MAYPSPTLYTYRVREVQAVNKATGENGYFEAQFSTDSGTTWAPALQTPFTSLVEAYQAIAALVNNEAQFQNAYLNPNKFNVAAVVPTVVLYTYPPA